MRWTFQGSGIAPQIQLYTPAFPVGTIAELSELHTDYTGKKVSRYIQKSADRWTTDPGGNEYFTSTGALLTNRSVARFVSPTGQQLWPSVGEEVPAANGEAPSAVEPVKPKQPPSELPVIPADVAKSAAEKVAQGAMTAAEAAQAIDEGTVSVPHPSRKRWLIPAAGAGVLALGGLFGWLVTRK